jgi:DnaJ-class molecular chaperone
MAGGAPDFGKIMKLAQQVASQIEPPAELKTGKKLNESDMSNVISQITSSVSKTLTPDMIASIGGPSQKMSKKQGKQKIPSVDPEESKISFSELDEKEPQSDVRNRDKKKRIVEIESDESDEEDPGSGLRTKDMSFTLSVTLEELYAGSKKKLGIRRQKVDADGSYEEEKKKLSIKIEPGMIDEHVIRFNHMADEKQGYETGDVVVTLDVEEHVDFVRDGNNLLIEKEISVSEAFKPVIYLKHLNGKCYKIKGNRLDIFSDEDDLLKKVSGLGMPVLGEPGKFGDLFIRFKIVNNVEITDDIVEKLCDIFPSIQKMPEDLSEDTQDIDFEMVTESDLEFFDSDSDSDYDSEDDDSEYDSEESND